MRVLEKEGNGTTTKDSTYTKEEAFEKLKLGDRSDERWQKFAVLFITYVFLIIGTLVLGIRY